jgi:hypothetical protein
VPAHKDTTKKPADMLTKAKVSRLLKVDMLAAGMTEITDAKTTRKINRLKKLTSMRQRSCRNNQIVGTKVTTPY